MKTPEQQIAEWEKENKKYDKISWARAIKDEVIERAKQILKLERARTIRNTKDIIAQGIKQEYKIGYNKALEDVLKELDKKYYPEMTNEHVIDLFNTIKKLKKEKSK